MTKNQILEMFPVGDPLGRRILFDPVSAVIGGAGILTNIIGAKKGANAANSAAQIQSQAAAAAGQKVQQAVTDSNPQIIQGAANASDMALRSAGQVVDSAGQARDAATGAVTNANALLNPYTTAGAQANDTLSAGLKTGGDFNKMPTLADLQMDPGAAWQRQQTEKTLGRSAAARGGAISGSALMDLTNYETGALSQDYQNAFNRFRQSTQDRFNNLNTVAGRGAQVAGQQGSNLLNGAEYGGNITTDAYKSNLAANEFAGSQTYDAAKTTAANTIGGADRAADFLTQGANAQAAGTVGAANAWAGGLSGAANSAGAAYGLYQQGQQNQNLINLLKNPAAKGQ